MINKLLIKNQKGVSLIELLVYFSLLSIVLVIVVDLLFRTSEFSLEVSAKNQTQSDGRFITSRLTYDIHRADIIVTPANLGEVSTTLELTIGNENHVYSLVGSNLQYEVGGAQTYNVNSNRVLVNSISFQRLGTSSNNHTIKITLELEAVEAQKGSSTPETYEFVVGTR